MAHLILGVDEVGRGPLAGPVVAAAVALPADFKDVRIKDSKQLSAKMREYLLEVIKSAAMDYAVVAVGHQRIRQINIREASKLAMRLAIERVLRRTQVQRVLVDGNMRITLSSSFSAIEQQTIVRGDSLIVQISAASIVAKVHRDRLMAILDRRYPGYGLAGHAGYPTKAHRQAIVSLGPSAVHRIEFRGVKEWAARKFNPVVPAAANL